MALKVQVRGGFDGVGALVESTGSGPWWHQLVWGRSSVDGVNRFQILIIISDDKFRDELGRSIRRILGHGDANH